MVDQILAGLGLAACAGALLWMGLGPTRREALQRAARQGLRWPGQRRQARQEAAEVIERARRSVVERDGNVYRPKSFNGRDGRDRKDH